MILFRAVCILQMLITVFLAFSSLAALFSSGHPYFAMETVFLALMASLAILGLNLVTSHYPDKPVTGKLKRAFNWLFLLNFLLLAYLFGLFFREWKLLRLAAFALDKSMGSIPLQYYTSFLISVAILIFQLMILYGLYHLRRKLYFNFMRQQEFEFESENQKEPRS